MRSMQLSVLSSGSLDLGTAAVDSCRRQVGEDSCTAKRGYRWRNYSQWNGQSKSRSSVKWSAKARLISWYNTWVSLYRQTHVVWHLHVECAHGFQFQVLARLDHSAELCMVTRVHSFSLADQRYVCVNVQEAGSKVGQTSDLVCSRPSYNTATRFRSNE